MGSRTNSDGPRCGVHGPWMGQVESWASGLRRAFKTVSRAAASRGRLAGDCARDFWRPGSSYGGICNHRKCSTDPFDAGRYVYRNVKYGFSAVNRIGLTPEGPVLGPPGYEINLLYIACLVVLILGGAGPLSIDALRSRRRRRHLRVAA